MQPISEFKNQLFASHRERVKDFSFSHVVPKENVLPLVVSSGPSSVKFSFTFANRLNKEMVNVVSGLFERNFISNFSSSLTICRQRYEMYATLYPVVLFAFSVHTTTWKRFTHF